MKKVILTLGILLMAFTPTVPAWAGTINQYESDIIAAAKQVYTYDGVEYKVDPAMIAQLENYLAGDDVELNAQDRDQVIQAAFDNLEQGVKDGYLVPTQELTDSGVTDSDAGNTASDTSPGTSTSNPSDAPSADNGSSDNETSGNNSSAGSGINSEGSTGGNSANNSGSSTNNSSDTNITSASDNGQGTSTDNVLVQITEATTGTTENTNADTATTDTDASVIKNTGFNFSSTITIAAGMGLLMIIGMIVTMKLNFFAPPSE